MAQPAPFLKRPGVYHTMFLSGDQRPGHEAWLDETCELVEAFIEEIDDQLNDDRRAMVSFSIHLLADFLFAAYGAAARWDLLDPEDFLDLLEAEMSPVAPIVPATCGGLYGFMAQTGRLSSACGIAIATSLGSYAKYALENYPQPNRAARRLAARCARRHKTHMN